MTEEIPDWMQDARDGEMRARLQCNLCGVVKMVAILVPEPLRDKLSRIIQENPDEMLAATRAMAQVAADWLSVPLADGGVIDICPDCEENSPWLPGEPGV